TASNSDLRAPATAWVLASTPQNAEIDGVPAFPEARLINELAYGANRALINWYRIDQGARNESPGANEFPYTRLVNQQEIFQNRTPQLGLNDFRTFDITYLPDERGPYNFDIPGGIQPYSAGIGQDCRLLVPESRWGGIMRSLTQTNFEQANIEAVEFWMLDPFLVDTMGSEGKLVFHLGNVSEDILRDSRRVFEHGLPLTAEEAPTDTTMWGRIPRIQPTVNAFSNNIEARTKQDVGLDGVDDDGERTVYKPYLDILQNAGVDAACIQRANQDPANDNFLYFLDPSIPDNA